MSLKKGSKGRNSLYECFHCGCKAVVWDADFDFDDYSMEGEGIIHNCHCSNYGARIQYVISTRKEDTDGDIE